MIRRETRKAAVRKGKGNTYDYNTTDAANAGGMEAAMALSLIHISMDPKKKRLLEREMFHAIKARTDTEAQK